MALKSVAGVLLLTDDIDLRATPYNDGHFLTFNAVSQERVPNGKPILHYYRVNIFVSAAEKDRWKKQLMPGKVLFVQNGIWRAQKREGFAYPINELKVSTKDVSFLLDAKEKK